jgi:hypothetical protein
MLQVVLQHDLAADDARLIGMPLEPSRRYPDAPSSSGALFSGARSHSGPFLIEL